MILVGEKFYFCLLNAIKSVYNHKDDFCTLSDISRIMGRFMSWNLTFYRLTQG